MKSEYTQAQRAAASVYRQEQEKLRELEEEAEVLLSEGNYTQRERVLKKSDSQWSYLAGMRRMAEAMGFPGADLLSAAKDSPGP